MRVRVPRNDGRTGSIPAFPTDAMKYVKGRHFGKDSATRERVRAMALDGCTTAWIANQFGVSRRTVSNLYARIGVKVRPGYQRDPMIRARVMAAVADGCRTGVEVAAALGYQDRSNAGRHVRELRRDGLIEQVGTGRWARLSVTKKWTNDRPRR